MILGDVTIDPVEDVQCPIGAQSKQIVGGDAFRLTRLTDHEQLRQNGHWLQIDAESPKDLELNLKNPIQSD